jgi:hypothetical protein
VVLIISDKIDEMVRYVAWRDSVVERGGDRKSKFQTGNLDRLPAGPIPGHLVSYRLHYDCQPDQLRQAGGNLLPVCNKSRVEAVPFEAFWGNSGMKVLPAITAARMTACPTKM